LKDRKELLHNYGVSSNISRNYSVYKFAPT
jgi:hypothetical protein